MQMRLCEVCSQRVSVHNDGYGTHFYLPMERWAIVQEIAEQLKQLSTDPNIQRLTATDALIHASTLIRVGSIGLQPREGAIKPNTALTLARVTNAIHQFVHPIPVALPHTIGPNV